MLPIENNKTNYRATREDEVIATKHSPSPSYKRLELQFRGVSLVFLNDILAKGEEYGRASGNDIRKLLTLPETKSRRCSLAELYGGPLGRDSKPLVGKMRFFVSHAWSYQFSKLVEAIENFELEGNGNEREGAYYFIDYFAINQWESACELKSLEALIKGSDALVLVLWPLRQPKVMSRAWCLYELHISMKCNIPIYVTVPDDQWISATNLDALEDWKVDSRKSGATKKSDEYMIKTEIKQSIGFACLDLKVYEAIVTCIRILVLPEHSDSRSFKSTHESFVNYTESTSKRHLTRMLSQLLLPSFSSLIGGEFEYISAIIVDYIGYPFYCRCSSNHSKGASYCDYYVSCVFCTLRGAKWYCIACKSSFESEPKWKLTQIKSTEVIICHCGKEYITNYYDTSDVL